MLHAQCLAVLRSRLVDHRHSRKEQSAAVKNRDYLYIEALAGADSLPIRCGNRGTVPQNELAREVLMGAVGESKYITRVNISQNVCSES